jgi:hypothetical protein
MTAPYAPTLLSPVRSQGAANNPVTFKLRFNAPTAQPATTYRIMRRALPSGTLEYLTDANTWTTVDTYRTAIPNIEDGDEITITNSSGWVDGTVYEWSANFRGGTGAETGATSDTALFISITPLVPTLNVETPALDTRPPLRWINTTTRPQRSFQLAVYTKATYDSAGFNAADPGWQAQAVWLQDSPYVASELFRYITGADLATGVTYRPVIRVQDKFGVWSAWAAGNEFTTSFTPPTAPIVTVTPNVAEGVMDLAVNATFNLVGSDSSSFDNPNHGWINLFNSLPEHDDTNDWLLVTGVGRTFAEADTAYTTYAAWDTALGTFAQQAAARTSVTTESQITLRKDNTFLIPVTVGQNYSMIFDAFPIGYAATGKCMIRWLTAAFAQVSVSTGGNVSLPPNTWTSVPSGAFTAPATAAWAELQLSVTTVYGQQFRIDNVAFARSDSVVWSPGGLSVDLKFIIQRRQNGGDWEYVWGATRDDPLPAQNTGITVATIKDRAYPIGTGGVEYRIQVITTATGKTVSSAFTTVAATQLNASAWWLRSYSGDLADIRLRAMSFDYGEGVSNVVNYVQNKVYGRVQETGDAAPHDVSVQAWLFDKSEYEGLRALLQSKGILYVQRNIGDGFYIRVTGMSRYRQQQAVGEQGSQTPRHLHQVSFTAEVVGVPEELEA